ncbi:MAG: hypothetical protein GX963_10065 [Bacteroidales bacterium]|nr:hypothetical protein [Bacteroidales bacterium]
MAKENRKKKQRPLKIKNQRKEEIKVSLKNSNNTPLFCFKHFDYELLEKYKKHKSELCYEFLKRLQKLTELGWDEIRKSDRHNYGMEKIPVKQIKVSLPNFITPDVEDLHVFRVNNSNIPFIGLQVETIFYVLFIEPEFGVVYKH